MAKITAFPAAIKLMIVLVIIDVIAVLMFSYFDIVSDPDINFLDIDSLITLIFPPFYLAGMVWLIRIHAPITKIVFFIVFALELISFMVINFETSGFDVYSILSLISTLSLFGCIYIMYTDVGKKWFEVNNK